MRNFQIRAAGLAYQNCTFTIFSSCQKIVPDMFLLKYAHEHKKFKLYLSSYIIFVLYDSIGVIDSLRRKQNGLQGVYVDMNF